MDEYIVENYGNLEVKEIELLGKKCTIITNNGKPSDILEIEGKSQFDIPAIERKKILSEMCDDTNPYFVSSLGNSSLYAKLMFEKGLNLSIMEADSKYVNGENRKYVLLQHEDKSSLNDYSLNVPEKLLEIKDKWVPYVVQHHYKGDSIHTDIRIKVDDGLVGFTLFTPGNAKSLDKFSNSSSMIMRGEWKRDIADEEWLNKNEYIEDKEWVILCVDKGKARVHDVEGSKVVLQFNGSRKDVDMMPLQKAGIKSASPKAYKNLEGYWVVFDSDGMTMMRKVKNPDANQMAMQWIERLGKKSIIPNDKIKAIYEHFANEDITYVNRLSKELCLHPRTVYRFREMLGFK